MLDPKNSENFDVLDFSLPYMQISCPGSGCTSHAELDMFIAHWRDEVWKYIFPPNSLGCYCAVYHLPEQDVPLDAPGRMPGIPRLPEELLKRCGQFYP
jgi:hypothetical protein